MFFFSLICCDGLSEQVGGVIISLPGGRVSLSEILEEEVCLKKKLNVPEKAPRVSGQLFGVRLPMFNFRLDFKTTSNLQNFLFP